MKTVLSVGTYWMFVGIVFLGILFIFFTLPETKGTQLEDVERLFDRPLFRCCQSEKYYELKAGGINASTSSSLYNADRWPVLFIVIYESDIFICSRLLYAMLM